MTTTSLQIQARHPHFASGEHKPTVGRIAFSTTIRVESFEYDKAVLRGRTPRYREDNPWRHSTLS
jgi:hypothetical protein